MALIQFAPRNLSSFITKGSNLSESESKSQKLDPIDAVITWVDGDDPKLKAKQRKYFNVDDTEDDRISAERFSELGELYYCIALILKNAPFINRIYVVTDDQYPIYLGKIKSDFGQASFDKIQVIDHTQIFEGYEEYLPVFNSVSIETVLHKIPGLSDRYVYFNDDVFLGRKMVEEDFFIGNRPVLRGKYRNSASLKSKQKRRVRKQKGSDDPKVKKFRFKDAQYAAFRLIGEDEKYFWHDHTPHTFYRPRIEKFLQKNSEALKSNISFRIRDVSQWDPVSLANALELASGNQNITKTCQTYIKPAGKSNPGFYFFRKKILHNIKKKKFICIQSLSSSNPTIQKKVTNWLERLLR